MGSNSIVYSVTDNLIPHYSTCNTPKEELITSPAKESENHGNMARREVHMVMCVMN